MRRKDAERELARALRRQGASLRAIARTVGVSLCSASVWTRDITEASRPAPIPLPPDAEAPIRLPVWRSGQVRRCARCGRWLPLELFNRHGTGRQWYCRRCFKAYHANNRARAAVLAAQRVVTAREFVAVHLDAHPCVDCGESDTAVLEFDHLRDKRADVSALVHRGAPSEVLRQEIAKCEVLCVNCHRRRSARRLDSPKAVGDSPRWAARSAATGRNVALVYAALGGGCVDCGERDLCVLDFDHVGEKRSTVSRLVRHGYGQATIRAELSRCEVRCGNCHRRVTARRRAAGS